MSKDWFTDEERAAMERDRPYMRAEAWSAGLVLATGIVIAVAGYFGWR